ncbi:hypothetical protein DACRYDRAFT_112970 [Dacryopinax primogenitus]|uniref:Uncharacterized protein n=1 Tax=Dacryopinax primogenitus (strain DJM 731) TaxID=1858805 RepID=M5G7Q6_DACPD|nr:uncharacterized protein DACRYDRAFT_112970 [Dacryopinax primogenitus]EJU06226.1 hypothetical protein DACRYDRAFT_112970 [Dacryopinax primogenitus]
MPYENRNAYYLRISPYTVLPMYLYLDERHTSWMTDTTLQFVLEDLRHRIGPKLRDESGTIMNASAANKTKPSVDVHRGTTYQFAYFLRKADPHTLLVKRRDFVLRPSAFGVKKEESQSPEPPPVRGKKRGKTKPTPKKSGSIETNGKGKKRKRGEQAALERDGPEPSEEDATLPPRRSGRTRAQVSYTEDEDEVDREDDEGEDNRGAQEAEEDDFELDEEDTADAAPEPLFRPSTPPRPPSEPEVKPEPADPSLNGSIPPTPTDNSVIDFSMDPDEEEENKPKPELQLSYQGFSIFGCALCVIVEPYPPIRYSVVPQPRARQTSLPVSWASSRSASMEPVGTGESRGTTPLFRAETPFDDQRFAAGTPAVDREETPLFRLETAEPEMRGHRFAAGRPDGDREQTPLFRFETPEPEMMRGASLAPSLRSPSPFVNGEDEPMDEDGSTIMEFSQVLSSAGAGRFGGRDDGDEGGEGFYGDADEGSGNM